MQTQPRYHFQDIARDWRFYVLALILTLALIAGLSIGAVTINLLALPQIITRLASDSLTHDLTTTVLLEIRAPRVLLGLIVGMTLGFAGASFQALFRNPLADPSIVGVSAGAATGAIAFIVFDTQHLLSSTTAVDAVPTPWLAVAGLPLAAMLGSMLAAVMLYLLSRRGSSIASLLLAGIAVNALFNALNGLLIFFSDDQALRELTFWSLGSLARADSSLAVPVMFIALMVGVINITCTRALNALSIGENQAYFLGYDTQRLKYLLLFANTAAIGAVVALSGIIGFVGLIVPHIARMIFGADNRYVIPASAMLGATLLLTADVLARIVVLPAEMPIGVITGLLGSPFFIWLLLNSQANLRISS